MKFNRQLKYYYLRFIRLRGEPQELALGMAMGAFTGMLPIIPFQSALALTMAVFFKASKITAVLGTWVSNPLNWYFLYYFSYKLGAFILGLPERNSVFASIMSSVRAGDDAMIIAGKILGAGSWIIGGFLLGGLIMGVVVAPPVYYVSLYIFGHIRSWREERKNRRRKDR